MPLNGDFVRLIADQDAGEFQWVNQGSATVSNVVRRDGTTGYSPLVTDRAYLYSPAAAGDSLKIRKRARGGRYRIDVGVKLLLGGNLNQCGLLWRQNASGLLVAFSVYLTSTTPLNWSVDKYNSPTSFNSLYNTGTTDGLGLGGTLYLRLQDDGVNRLCAFSTDGLSFLTVESHARANFMTADEVGVFANSGNATYAAGITVESWIERED